MKLPEKDTKSSVKSDVMLRAVRQVRFDNKSVQGTARDFEINYQTLLRYCNKSTDVQITGHHGEPSIEIGYRKKSADFYAFTGGRVCPVHFACF